MGDDVIDVVGFDTFFVELKSVWEEVGSKIIQIKNQ